MPNNLKDDELLLRCSCGSLDHMASLTHDTDIGDMGWYLYVTLDNYLPWHKRMLRAVQYIFGARQEMWGGVILRDADITLLQKFITPKEDK